MNKLLIFIGGAVTGSVIAWYITKEKYKQIADEEINSVIDTFKERESKLITKKSDILKDESNEDISQSEKIVDINSFQQIVDIERYNNDTSSDDECTIKLENVPEKIAPYIISEDEYGNSNYEEKTLILCADRVLLDENDEIVDPESVIGNTLDQFDVYDEYLYIRDDNEQIDYVVIRSEKLSSEIIPEEGNE